MNVSTTTTNINSYVNNNQRPQNPQDLTQDQREVITGLAENKTTNDKIDAYVQGTQDANEVYDKASGESSESATQAYVDFSKDVQRSNNLNTAVDSGADFSSIFKEEESSPLSSLQLSVQNFNTIQSDVKRSENINTYIENSNFLY